MLRRRAAGPPAPPPAPAVPACLVVAVGDRRVALPAARIVEVARIGGYTPLPCEDPANLGVVLHRDALVPLVDVAPRIGARRAGPIGAPALCVFVETETGVVGFPIDRVLGLEPARDGGADGVPILDPAVPGGGHAESPAR